MHIFEQIAQIAALIQSEKRKKCALARIQLIHIDVLNYLSTANQYTDTPAATAAYFGMTRGTVSQSLILLEKKGYIEKNQDKIDKRIIHVKLLPPGQAILNKVRNNALYTKATKLFNRKMNGESYRDVFINALIALQKASQSRTFTTFHSKKTDIMNKNSVFDVIELMAALIRSEERKKCTELKLQMVHFQVLEYLSQCNKYSDKPAAIANYLGITRGTVSQTLIILEKREFLEKIQDEHDKRVYHIRLLEKGIETLKKAKPQELYEKANEILQKESSHADRQEVFTEALTALQKANESYTFGVCKTCRNFSVTGNGYFCLLTRENLTESDSEKICQEHQPSE
jgi:MarR family transcriptional repressor of emrRAB